MSTRKYAYPARFENEENMTISVYFPDLDGCQTYDDSMEGAALMAKEALEGYIETLLEAGRPLPAPSNMGDVAASDGLVMMVVADTVNMERENKPIKKTLSIPRWLDREATRAHINFSGVLQEALKQKLGVM